MEAIRRYKPNDEVAFAFKYLKRGQSKALESKLLETANQLEACKGTPIFKEKTTVKAWALVVLNNKLHVKVVQ